MYLIPRLFLHALCGLLMVWSATAAAAGKAPLERAQGLLQGLNESLPVTQYRAAAGEFGTLVDELRQSTVDDDTLVAVRKVAAGLRQRAEARLRAAETAAGDDEGALERFYRSQEWDDLSFSLIAFPFWGSWLDLTLAERPGRAADRLQLLWRAKRGFRAASMQIYQPALVYGGWLGLGFVAVAEKDTAHAKEIFDNLIKALSYDDKHPIRKAAETELKILSGALPSPEPIVMGESGGAHDPANARAIALLQQHRKTKVGAREAGALLRETIAAGGMTPTLLASILEYQNEIVSEDLGAYSPLVAAEFAFTNAQWFTAVQKYKAFFAAEPHDRGMDFNRFRYRQAVACLNSDLNEDAARLAEQLLKRPGLDAGLNQAATKMAWIARARHAEAKSTPEAREALDRAAKRFIAASPQDPDVVGAKVSLAQNSGDAGAALQLLQGAKSPDNARGSVETTRFFIVAQQFARDANRPGAAVETLAREGINLWDGLPDEQKKNPDNYAFLLQLRAVADPDPPAVLKAITLAEQKPGVSTTAQRGYYWARLRLYERMNTPRRALEELAAVSGAVPGWQVEQLYPWLRRLPDHALQLDFIHALAPRLKSLPEMERRFRLYGIELLLAAHRGEEAYTEAKSLVADYPKAGDAYRRLGQAARATKRYLEADEAWGIITAKVPPSFEVWWEGMLERIEIRSESTRPEAACELVTKVARQKPPTRELENRWNALRARQTCARTG